MKSIRASSTKLLSKQDFTSTLTTPHRRADFDVTGDSVTFNKTVYDETRSYWSDIITLQQAADARAARYNTSQSTNPKYSMTDLANDFSAGESAAYLMILGNITTRTVPKKFVEYLFENERLPAEIGWKRSDHVFTRPDLDKVIDLIYNATGATGEALRRMRSARDIHAGRY